MRQDSETNHTTPLAGDRLNETQAAAFLGFQPSTIRKSRSTGLLAGVPAPRYLKLGKRVLYQVSVLNDWLGQFPEIQNTAASTMQGGDHAR